MVKSHPEKTTFLGKSPADPTRIIPPEEVAKHCVDLETFRKLGKDPKAVVVDIRDPDQRAKEKFDMEARSIPLDRINSLLNNSGLKASHLLFVDTSGKRVEWLMYHLIDKGFTDFTFLEGGIAGTQAKK